MIHLYIYNSPLLYTSIYVVPFSYTNTTGFSDCQFKQQKLEKSYLKRKKEKNTQIGSIFNLILTNFAKRSPNKHLV